VPDPDDAAEPEVLPAVRRRGKLLPKFLIVSNMQVADPRNIVGGNQRVVRPRLEDARFFYNQDRKTRLEARVPQLGKVVYHNKLGSQLERAQRIKLLAGSIARQLKADVLQTERAAELAKADLLTGMVGEFPELQGVMDATTRTRTASRATWRRRSRSITCRASPATDCPRLPPARRSRSPTSSTRSPACSASASIPPAKRTRSGLRRAALGIVRILVEMHLPLSLHELAKAALAPFKSEAEVQMQDFIYDRFASYLKELGFSALQIDSVLSGRPTSLHIVIAQLEAVKAFRNPAGSGEPGGGKQTGGQYPAPGRSEG
jgi:glycyl-tRNA synthetase beta chain